jgi:hypothetical protein
MPSMMSSLIWMLACPLGMAAMGGLAWGLGRLPGRRAQRLAKLSRRATCMSMGSHQAAQPEEGASGASAGGKIPTHV